MIKVISILTISVLGVLSVTYRYLIVIYLNRIIQLFNSLGVNLNAFKLNQFNLLPYILLVVIGLFVLMFIRMFTTNMKVR